MHAGLETRGELILENILEPLALPATGGLTVALVVFYPGLQLLGMGAPLRAGANDSPTNLLQPARLEALAPFPVTGMEESGHSGPHALLVATTVNALGQAVTYEIIAGRITYDSAPTRSGPYVFAFPPADEFWALYFRRPAWS